MRVCSWNINGIKARADRLSAWIELRKPDLLALQEVRSTSGAFPYGVFRDHGYEVTTTEHVALASREALGPATDLMGDGRALAINTKAGRFIGAYVPNGQKAGTARHDAKLEWLDRFVEAVGNEVKTNSEVILAADMNIARGDLDVWAPERCEKRNLFTQAERDVMSGMLGVGLVDVFREIHGQNAGVYSWWNYAHDSFNRNRGWRLDYILTSPTIASKVDHAVVDVVERGQEKPSDHAPLWVDIR